MCPSGSEVLPVICWEALGKMAACQDHEPEVLPIVTWLSIPMDQKSKMMIIVGVPLHGVRREKAH